MKKKTVRERRESELDQSNNTDLETSISSKSINVESPSLEELFLNKNKVTSSGRNVKPPPKFDL